MGDPHTARAPADNEGDGPAKAPWTDYVNFSTMPSLANSITFTNATRMSNVPAGQSYSVSNLSFTIPNGLSAGTYYLILRIDGVNNVYEGAEEGDNPYPNNVVVTIP